MRSIFSGGSFFQLGFFLEKFSTLAKISREIEMRSVFLTASFFPLGFFQCDLFSPREFSARGLDDLENFGWDGCYISKSWKSFPGSRRVRLVEL